MKIVKPTYAELAKINITCHTCRKVLLGIVYDKTTKIGNFYGNGNGGLELHCIDCKKASQIALGHKNRLGQKGEAIWEYIASYDIYDGETHPWSIMTMHHLDPSLKAHNVGDLVGQLAASMKPKIREKYIKLLLTEIASCIPLRHDNHALLEHQPDELARRFPKGPFPKLEYTAKRLYQILAEQDALIET